MDGALSLWMRQTVRWVANFRSIQTKAALAASVA